MKKNRNLAVAVFLGALVICGMQSQAAAQENLGENKGTGDPTLRVGSWDLIKIENTAYGFGIPRQTKVLPVYTRERKGIVWGYGTRRITADLVFKNLKETVTQNNAGVSDFGLKVFVNASVTGEGKNSGNAERDFVTMKCTFDFTSPSEQAHLTHDYSYRQYLIYAGSYYPVTPSPFWFSKKGEFECGADDMRQRFKPGEDFTLNYRLLATDDYFGSSYDVDVTYHFYYRWAGWRDPGSSVSGSTSSLGDVGVGSLDRDGQYRWAQRQEASTLESRLILNAARLFGSPSVPSEKLSSAFADISVIIADRASSANFSSDDKDATSTNWSTHQNRAARQDPKVSLENLQQRLSAAFKYLSRSLQDSFFADVSVAMAKAEVAEQANQVAAQGSTSGLTIKTKKPVFAPNERIEVEYANSAANERDWIALAHPGEGPQGRGLEDRWVYVGKELSGIKTFNGIAEGPYDALYVSWESGNNRILARVPFTVGTAPPPPSTARPTSPSTPPSTARPTTPSTGGPPPTTGQPPATVSSDLSGFWVDDTGGGAVYRVRQLGNKVYWSMDATAKGEYVNVFHGVITGNMIDGEWLDMPGSPLRPALVAATLGLRIESNDRLVKVRSGNHYPAQVWTRQSATSAASASGTKCAEGNPQKTVTIEVPANRAWTPTGVFLNSCTQVMVQASGTIQAAASGGPQGFYHAVPPGGRAQFHPDKPQQLMPALSMLGRIGDGPVVSIGPFARWYAGGPYGSGELFLGINDDGVDDNSGVWQVRITTFGAPAQPPANSGGGPVAGAGAGKFCSEEATYSLSLTPSTARPGEKVAVRATGRIITDFGEANYRLFLKGHSEWGLDDKDGARCTTNLTAPREPGVYELLLSNYGYDRILARASLTVVARSDAATGLVQKVLPVGAQPTGNREAPKVEEIPDEVVATSKPPTRSRPADTTAARTRNRTEPPQVEEIPDEVVATSKPPTRSRPADTTAARTRNRTEALQVEEIPDEVVATSKPPTRSRPADTTAARTRNRREPPQVEAIPDEVVATSRPPTRSRPANTTAARTRNRREPPQVEEIPKVAVKPNRPRARAERPGTTNTTSTGGRNQPTTQRQPPTQRQPARGVWTLVSTTVSPEIPAKGAVTWEYTSQGSSAHYTLYNGDKANFQWTPPPQQIDSNGFTVSLSVEGIPGPNSHTIAVFMNVSGPRGLISDTPVDQQGAYVKAENGRRAAQKSVAFTPMPIASELEVSITLFGSITYTYKYRRAQ